MYTFAAPASTSVLLLGSLLFHFFLGPSHVSIRGSFHCSQVCDMSILTLRTSAFAPNSLVLLHADCQVAADKVQPYS